MSKSLTFGEVLTIIQADNNAIYYSESWLQESFIGLQTPVKQEVTEPYLFLCNIETNEVYAWLPSQLDLFRTDYIEFTGVNPLNKK